MREVNHLMLHLDYRKSLFTSRALFSTLDRFGLKGTFLLKPSLTRDFIVLRALTEQEKKVTVIGREVNGVGKAFSILSGRYAPIDQSVIFDIIKKIEDRGSSEKLSAVLGKFPTLSQGYSLNSLIRRQKLLISTVRVSVSSPASAFRHQIRAIAP